MLQRPPRDTRLDLLRGWLQLQIFASHAHGSLIGIWGISAAWGLSDSSEQFLFLSGFALGSVLVLKEHRAGPRAAWRDLMLRVARLWRTHLIVVCGFAALVIATEMAFRWPGEAAAMGWSWLLVEPWLALPAAAILLYQPQYMGILPVFILCMLALALLIRGMERVGAWALLPPLALYGAVQAWGWHLPGLGGTEVEFNPLAYVVVVLIPPRPMTPRAWPAQALAAAGRNSLNVFCLGLFFSYAAASLFRAFPGAVPWLDLPLVGGGALGLMAVAQAAERRRRDPALAR
ncbi:OpgC domain-containing protein [Belnapia rosea]|uniref:OpgC protein n=1 Tax=Belnapia rosea TaxID=938405 RepID=A0A1G6KJX8_9PROT|nr:OpgC domain-containing protein [Belnapia rosea]SDC31389.1 OpgC protein [Belnapia rosea]